MRSKGSRGVRPYHLRQKYDELLQPSEVGVYPRVDRVSHGGTPGAVGFCGFLLEMTIGSGPAQSARTGSQSTGGGPAQRFYPVAPCAMAPR